MKEYLLIGFACFFSSIQCFASPEFLSPLAGESGNRYESFTKLRCVNGKAKLPGFYQYSADANGEFRKIADAQDAAPFIWLLRDKTSGVVKLGLYADVYAEYLLCDRYGNTRHKSKKYPHLAIYEFPKVLTDDLGELQLRGFRKIATQGLRTTYLDNEIGLVSDLTEDLVHSDSSIDGPYDFLVRTNTKPNLKVHPSASSGEGFIVEFPDGCGPNNPLTVHYSLSKCSDDNRCDEIPTIGF